MYTRGLVFIGADNADARSLFSTFKAGIDFVFTASIHWMKDPNITSVKPCIVCMNWKCWPRWPPTLDLSSEILIGTLSEFEQFSGKLIDQLLMGWKSKPIIFSGRFFQLWQKPNIFVFRSAMKEESYNENFFRYMAHAAYNSQKERWLLWNILRLHRQLQILRRQTHFRTKTPKG